MLASVPTAKISSGLGSSTEASCWVARKIFLSVARASSRARRELSRPTMNGFIIWGKMTRSRTGIMGTRFDSVFSRLNMGSVVILLLLERFFVRGGAAPVLSGFFEQRPVDLPATDHFAGHDEFAEFALGRQVVHELEHEVFENHAQSAGADLALQGKFRNSFQGVIGKPEAHVLKFE